MSVVVGVAVPAGAVCAGRTVPELPGPAGAPTAGDGAVWGAAPAGSGETVGVPSGATTGVPCEAPPGASWSTVTGVPVLRGAAPAAASGSGVPAETAPPSAGRLLAAPGCGT